MEETEVNELATEGIYNHERLKGVLQETHISWIILTKKHAFKLKKPVKLSFLDFSTLDLREKYCKKELMLNKRYTDIYLAVCPVRFHHGKYEIGGEKGQIIDYVVQMKKMSAAKKMDFLLKQGKVDKADMHRLAKTITDFHKDSIRVNIPFNIDFGCSLFNDIKANDDFINEKLGDKYSELVSRSIQWSNNFLLSHSKRFQERIDKGFKRDLHGDLHGGNIFLYKKPVLFDCIEFNDQYRQIDVLYEIAFLCMDLEAFDQEYLARAFLSTYLKLLPCCEDQEDEHIFIYFKSLRANIRAKVHATTAARAHFKKDIQKHIEETQKYLILMKKYMENVQAL